MQYMYALMQYNSVRFIDCARWDFANKPLKINSYLSRQNPHYLSSLGGENYRKDILILTRMFQYIVWI